MFIDGSSSAYFVAELLPSVGGITVITNSVDVMSMLSGYDIKAYCTGGEISGDNRAVLVGGYTLDFVKKIRADVAILSVQGISAYGDFFDCYAEEVAVRNLMMQNATRKILLCDSSKFGKTCFYNMGTVKDIDVIITEGEIPEDILEIMNMLGKNYLN